MKKIKYVITLLLLVFITSGCDVTYDLKIEEDLKIKETIVALEEEQYNDLAHDFLLDRISIIYADRYDGYNNIYDFGVVSEGTKIGNNMMKEYDSVIDFSNNSAVFQDFLKDYSVTTNNNIVNINATLNDDLYDPNNLAYILVPNNIIINIDVPFEVINANADIKKGNIYTWKITDDKRTADIILSFDKNRLSNHIYVLNIGISYVILLMTAIVFLAVIIAIIIYNKIRGINRI